MSYYRSDYMDVLADQFYGTGCICPTTDQTTWMHWLISFTGCICPTTGQTTWMYWLISFTGLGAYVLLQIRLHGCIG